MRRELLILSGSFVLALGTIFVAHVLPIFSAGQPVMHVNGHTIRLLTARTEAEREHGLSGHGKLPADEGMLFYFDTPGIYPFWMPNMKFPLDIIWMQDGVVTDEAELGTPVPGQPIPAYTPKATADRVLEIDAGLAQRYGLVPGAHVQLPN